MKEGLSEIFNDRDDLDVLVTRAMMMNDKDKDVFIKKLQDVTFFFFFFFFFFLNWFNVPPQRGAHTC